MTEPRRWLTDSTAPEAVRSLLRAVEVPSPPSVAKQAELARKLAAMTSVGRAAAAVSKGALAWKAGLACGLCLGAGALLTADSPARPSAAMAPVSAIMSAPEAVAAAAGQPGSTIELVPAPESRAASLPVSVERHGASSRRAPISRAPLPTPDALAQEEALLEPARRGAISAPAKSLQLLDEHRRRFSNGQLAPERLFLSVQVLERLGQMKAAREQAELLTRRFPRSVYAAQLAARRQ